MQVGEVWRTRIDQRFTFSLVHAEAIPNRTFPRSPLEFPKVGVTRYGCKAGRSGGIFPSRRGLRVARFVSALRARNPEASPERRDRAIEVLWGWFHVS